MARPTFPAEPVTPAEILDGYLPGVLAGFASVAGTEQLRGELGLKLCGEGGGEWRLELGEGRLSLRPGSRLDAPLTLVQTVEDWRDTLWQGRGAGLGRLLASLFRADAAPPPAPPRFAQAAQAGFEALRKLDGLLRVAVVESGRPRWCADLRLGPGELPARPTTVVSMRARDADRLLAGTLKPMEAFLSGRLRLSGDYGLLLQLYAAGRGLGGALEGPSRRA